MLNKVFALILFLIVLIPLTIFVLITSIETKTWGIFTHSRVGLHGKPFLLFKIRTLKEVPESSVTQSYMERTLMGHFLRKYHIDEWPQLLNILIGDMNFVGPRPDIEKAYRLLSDNDYEILTSIKPGLTGISQLEFFQEEELIAQYEEPEKYYFEVLWPMKVKKNIDYIQNKNQYSEIKIIFDTLKKFF